MKRWCFVILTLLWLGSPAGAALKAGELRPSLAVLPLKEEGRKDLGDVSDTINFLVASTFADSGAYRLIEPGQVAAALQELKTPDTDPAHWSSIPGLGKRLGASLFLAGSYFAERNTSNGNVSVTLTLRMVNAGDGSVSSRFMETAEGATLGSVTAALRRQLSARAAATAPAPAVVPVPAAAPAPAVVAVPAAVPAPAVVPVPATVPAPAVVAIPAAVPVPADVPAPATAPVPAPLSAGAPAPVPAPIPAPAPARPAAPSIPLDLAPAPASAPVPQKTSSALLDLREGSMNGVYFRMGGLSHYGARLEDFEFLQQTLAKRFGPEVAVTFNVGTRGSGDDPALNRGLVQSHRPDTLVVLTIQCRTKSERSYILLNKTHLQAELQIDFIAPASLKILAEKTVRTDFVELKGNGTKFPPALMDQLAERLAGVLPVLPF